METKTAAELHIKRLYHYQCFNEPDRLARIFTEGTIYFSSPRDFNDPWDCRPCFSKSVLDDPEEYERIVQWFIRCGRTHDKSISEDEHVRRQQELRTNRKLLESWIDGMTSGMELAIQRQYRVYCLSIHPDSTLMWSHYAASCKGLCLEFSVRNELFCGALKIDYLNRYPIFNISTTDEDSDLRPLLTKSAIWKYEDEFRLIASEQPFVFPGVPTTNQGFLALPEGALQSVIVGELMPAPNRELVRSLVKESGWNVSLKVATVVSDRYEFEIRDLD